MNIVWATYSLTEILIAVSVYICSPEELSLNLLIGVIGLAWVGGTGNVF